MNKSKRILGCILLLITLNLSPFFSPAFAYTYQDVQDFLNVTTMLSETYTYDNVGNRVTEKKALQ